MKHALLALTCSLSLALCAPTHRQLHLRRRRHGRLRGVRLRRLERDDPAESSTAPASGPSSSSKPPARTPLAASDCSSPGTHAGTASPTTPRPTLTSTAPTPRSPTTPTTRSCSASPTSRRATPPRRSTRSVASSPTAATGNGYVYHRRLRLVHRRPPAGAARAGPARRPHRLPGLLPPSSRRGRPTEIPFSGFRHNTPARVSSGPWPKIRVATRPSSATPPRTAATKRRGWTS